MRVKEKGEEEEKAAANMNNKKQLEITFKNANADRYIMFFTWYMYVFTFCIYYNICNTNASEKNVCDVFKDNYDGQECESLYTSSNKMWF